MPEQPPVYEAGPQKIETLEELVNNNPTILNQDIMRPQMPIVNISPDSPVGPRSFTPKAIERVSMPQT